MTTTNQTAAQTTALANQVKALYSTIARLSKAEAITKTTLGELSRTVLQYHSDGGHDVGVVNRLLSALSPVNLRAARIFFKAHMPYAFDEESNTFGKLVKKEAIREGRYYAMAEFLKDEANTIWTWQAANIDMEKATPNYAGMITKAVEKALKHDTDKGAIIKAMFDGGVTPDDLIAILSQMEVVNVINPEPATAGFDDLGELARLSAKAA